MDKKTKRYFVNVHYDMFMQVQVDAESEEEALELAKEKAGNMDSSELTYGDYINSCITDIL